jgi:hypothetical protein
MVEAVKSLSVQIIGDERWPHEDNAGHEEGGYSGFEWEQKKLTPNMYRVRNVRSSETKVNKTSYNVTITNRILKRLIVSGCKVNIELHGSLSSSMISKRSSIEKILNILLLRQKRTPQAWRRSQSQESTSEG